MPAKGSVSFKSERCKGCSVCVAVCPKKIIFLDVSNMNSYGYYPASIKKEDMDKCIACISCALMCPDGIITIDKVEE